jgi:hypothetical protein
MSKVFQTTLGVIKAIGNPPPFNPLNQIQLLELEYGGICKYQM